MTDLPPHPLVVAVAESLGGARTRSAAKIAVAKAKAAADAAEAAAAAAAADEVEQAKTDATAKVKEAREAAAALKAKPEDEDLKEKAEAAAKALSAALHVDTVTILAVNPDLPELTAFAGFLGGTVDAPRGEDPVKWQLLYLDAKLFTWLIVRPADIVFHQRLTDDNAPFNERDVIWVKANAPLARSSGSPALWLSGEFTRAADFTPPLTGGTAPSPATGIFCEAQTPNCCPPRTNTIRC